MSAPDVLNDWKLWCKHETLISWIFRRPQRSENGRCLAFSYNNGTGGGVLGAPDYEQGWSGLLFFHRGRPGRASGSEPTPSFRGWGHAQPPPPVRDETTAALLPSATTMKVKHPGRFPSQPGFSLVVKDSGFDPKETNREVMLVTAITADGTFTVRRGEMGTTAVAHPFDAPKHQSYVELVWRASGAPLRDRPLTVFNPPPTAPWVRIEIPWDASPARFRFYSDNQWGYPGGVQLDKRVAPVDFKPSGDDASQIWQGSFGGGGMGELVFEDPWWLIYRKTTAAMTRYGGPGADWLDTPLWEDD